jgi:hypothetical protein
MSTNQVNDANAVECARELARKTLAGELDPLLACREMAVLRTRLPSVPDSVMDTFVGVASEVDDLPLRSDRQHWAPAALNARDAEAADYRVRVKDVVLTAMKELVGAIEHPAL